MLDKNSLHNNDTNHSSIDINDKFMNSSSKINMPKKFTIPFRYKFIFSLVLLISAIVWGISLPNPLGQLSEVARNQILSESDCSGFAIGDGVDSKLICNVLSTKSQRSVFRDVPSLTGINKILFNVAYYSRNFAPWLSDLIGLDPHNIIVQFVLQNPNDELVSSGRSIRTIDMLVWIIPFQPLRVGSIHVGDYHDEYDFNKVSAVLETVLESNQMDFVEKYNNVLDITNVINLHYKSFAAEGLPQNLKKLYVTANKYIDFKSGQQNDSSFDLKELIRFFLYDDSPLLINGVMEINSLMSIIQQHGVKKLSSDESFLLSLFLSERKDLLDYDSRMSIIALLVERSDSNTNNNLAKLLLDEDPGVVTNYLKAFTDTDSVILKNSNNNVQKGIMSLANSLFQRTNFLSVKRQALLTMYQYRNADSITYVSALNKAKAMKNERMNATIDSISRM